MRRITAANAPPAIADAIPEWLEEIGFRSHMVRFIDLDLAQFTATIVSTRLADDGRVIDLVPDILTGRPSPRWKRQTVPLDHLPRFAWVWGVAPCGHAIDDQGHDGCLRCRRLRKLPW